MGIEFNKTEADFVYERYNTMKGYNDDEQLSLESPLESYETVVKHPVDFDGVADNGSDPALAYDFIMAADIGLNDPEPSSGQLPQRGVIHSTPAPERDELLESDALLAAGAAGLTGNAVYDMEAGDEAEEQAEEPPLEDIPDADELFPGTPPDPSAPPLDTMPGTDVLNGSTGEE